MAKTLSEAAADVPDGSHLKVDPETFEVEVCDGPGEPPGPESEGEAEECDWDASSSDEAEVVQAVAAKAGVEEDLPQKMEVEEEEAEPRPRRKKLQLGSAQILLLQAVGDADAANWSSLQQRIQSHNSSGDDKSGLLKRLEQLADLRQESREGAIQALQAERDRAWRISRAENMYREGLDQEMARLEKNNPVGPRMGEPLITDARLKADIAAGVGIWRARRDHRARERAARHRKSQPSAPATGGGYLMDVDPNEGGQALDEAMTNRARQELRNFRRELKTGASGEDRPRTHQKDSTRRKKIKKQRAKEKRAHNAAEGQSGQGDGSEARTAPGTGSAGPPTEPAEEGPRQVRFGEGPKTTLTEVHTYDPVDISQYAHWRMDLADSNGLALGDDEAEEALKQMQMLVADVDLLPPLYRNKDDGELKLRTGKPARMLRPRDFCLMVLEHGHWLGITALRDKVQDVWHISIQGLTRMDCQDEQEWQATLHQLTDIPPAKMRLREAGAQPRIPGACGFAALASIANQCQHCWDWNPMDATSYTADPVLDAKILNHLQNLRRCLHLHDAPDYYRDFVLQVRGIFLRTSLHHVVQQKVSLGRGTPGAVSRFATGPLVVASLLANVGKGSESDEEDPGSAVGYGALLALFGLLCWRGWCLCRGLWRALWPRSPDPKGGSSPSRRVGGSRRKVRFNPNKDQSPITESKPQGHVTIDFLGGPKTAKSLYPKGRMMRFANVQGHEEWDQEGWALLLDRYSKSTMAVYRFQYRWWQLFCRRRGIDPVRYVTHYDRQEEDLFLEYMVHCSVNEQKAPGTVKIRMAAIRSVHLSMGLPDPTAHLPRIPLAMAGIKRRWGTKVRRKPVTPEMLQWIGHTVEYGKSKEGSLMFAAVCFGYFFLLRASEYLCVGYNQPEKGLRGQDVALKVDGELCTLQNLREADEVILTIRSSKTDIYNRGEIRNHFRAEGEICPVLPTAI